MDLNNKMMAALVLDALKVGCVEPFIWTYNQCAASTLWGRGS